MGKRIISRARGAGGPRYRSPEHRYVGSVSYPKFTEGQMKAEVMEIVHDPGKSAPLARLKFTDGIEKYVTATEGMKKGDIIVFGATGRNNVAKLSEIQEGVPICSIELLPFSGPKICRSSGVYGTVITKGEKVTVKMSSGKIKEFNPNCLAMIGIPAGGGRVDKLFVKAGQVYHAKLARNKLWPRSSASKMNPVDHPFGGKTKPGWPKTVSRWAPPGQKVGAISSRRTGLRKK
ncbi:MAG: 50S ribosomal protein L2 [Candidatus Aenigmatarchaeota archaeon]